ncbi:MAG: YebC/PmpR family DNA-binding transcriptional regulator [Gemmataceae bacterium]
MSGHSHWATIKHKKGAIDAKRGKLWSKLSRAIIIAARHGGGDPTMNLKLRYAIDKAREVSMPRDNIERAIKRGTGEDQGEIIEELQYEGYGPGGVAILIDVTTDNRNRTVGEVRKLFERGGGKMGSAGSVAFLFERKGVFAVPESAIDEDTLMGVALDAGAEDVKRNPPYFEIVCDPAQFNAVQDALKGKNLELALAEVKQLAKAPKDVDTETGQKVLKLMEALDDHDDVQNVYSDVNVTEAMMAGH